MSLGKLPAIDSSFLLFSWDVGLNQLSRDALVSGGQCAYFRKETWNDIVDTLGDAMSDAHLSWDSKYTTFDGAHITEVYGGLSAAAFNSVRLNADVLFDIGWGWAADPAFRGYVGRKDFKGVASGKPDDVYPEYILELARGVNLLVEVLRGTADMAEGAYGGIASSNFIPYLFPAKSVPMSFADPAESNAFGGGVSLPSAPFQFYIPSESTLIGAAVSLPAKLLYSTENDSGTGDWAIPTTCKVRIFTFYTPSTSNNWVIAQNPKAAVIRSRSHMAVTKNISAIDVYNTVRMFSQFDTKSSYFGETFAATAISRQSQYGSVSFHDTTAKRCPAARLGYVRIGAISSSISEPIARLAAILTYAGYHAQSASVSASFAGKVAPAASISRVVSDLSGSSVSLPSAPLVGTESSIATEHGFMACPESKPMQSADQGKTAHNAVILPCKSASVEVGDLLSASEHFAVTDKPLSCHADVSVQSSTDTNVVIDSAWYPPVWVDDTLWIRQTHIATPNGDTLEVN